MCTRVLFPYFLYTSVSPAVKLYYVGHVTQVYVKAYDSIIKQMNIVKHFSLHDLNSEVFMTHGVSDCSAVLDSWQVDGVIIRVFNL